MINYKDFGLSEKQVSKLNDKEKLYLKAKLAYYNSDSPIISDEKFDRLESKIKKENPKSPVLNIVGAPVVDEKHKVELPYYMGSLDKIRPEDNNVRPFLTKYKGPWYVMDKLDGVAVLLDINGSDIKASTRGKAQIGTDISYLVPYLKLPKVTGKYALKAELVMKDSVFNRLSTDIKKKNARNLVSGIANAKKPNPKLLPKIDVVVHTIIEPKGQPSKLLKTLANKGFNVVHFETFTNLTEEQLIKLLEERKKESKYTIDGLVIGLDKPTTLPKNRNPDTIKAFKVQSKDNMKTVTVTDVTWESSKHGFLKPRVWFKPIDLQGVTISKATGFNAKFIKDNKIGPGSKIVITRSNEVIPHIQKVQTKTTAKMPKTEYKWTPTQVDIVLTKKDDTSKIKRIVNFFTTLDVENFNIGLARKLYEEGYTSILKIIKMTKDDFLAIPGFKDTLATKIYNNIQSKVKNATLLQLIDATGFCGRGIGTRRLKALDSKYGLSKLINDKNALAKIKKVEGFSDKTANITVDGFEKFKVWLNKSKLKPANKTVKVGTGPLNGKTIVFTGFRNKEWEKIIEQQGGSIGSTVTNKTDILIYTKESDKLSKAKQLGKTYMTPDQFERKYL